MKTRDVIDKQGSEADQSGAYSPPSFFAEYPTSVVYTDYRFLGISNLPNMRSRDIDYLELQGCFLIPRREALDHIVQQYFLRVHPFLPLLNEKTFWEMYNGRIPSNAPALTFSLLTFQALLFASSNVSLSWNPMEKIFKHSIACTFGYTEVARVFKYQGSEGLLL